METVVMAEKERGNERWSKEKRDEDWARETAGGKQAK
jgi:hypothetical protein